MSDRMSDVDYEHTQQALVYLGRLIRGLDIHGFLRRIDEVDAAAPILNPTLWMRGGQYLSQVKRLAEGALQFKKAADEIAAKSESGR